jgi:hypothetical protein
MPTKLIDHLEQIQLNEYLNLNSPVKIQGFLDDIPYSAEDRNRSPLQVFQDRKAHCLDGAVFAAAVLRQIGYPPIVIDMFPDPGRDDDHVLAIFKNEGHFGALAKSNFAGLRFREPIYRSLRELVLSYFEDFYNMDGEKTLRSYTIPYNLQVFDPLEWEWKENGLDIIEQRMKEIHRFIVLSSGMIKNLNPKDRRSYQAGMLGVNEAGLYKPHR